MSSITYLRGDATQPVGEGIKYIVHICNDIGAWGAGFVLAISRRWKEPEMSYRKWHNRNKGFKLGQVQFVKVENDIFVVNMIGQKGIKRVRKNPPIRYSAVEECLEKISELAMLNSATVHMPRIGCGLAGGKWKEIQNIIERTLLPKNIPVFVYDL